MSGIHLGQHHLSPEAIESQLTRILTSPAFLASPQLGKFLRFVIEETLAGQSDQIKQYTIGVRAFGYPADFDPRTDTVVRVHARRLRRALKDYYENNGVHDPIVIGIPKGSYIPLITPSADAPDYAEINPKFEKPSLAVLPFRNLTNAPDNVALVEGFGEELSIDLARFQELAVVAYYSSGQLRDQNIGIQKAGEQLGVDFVVTGTIRKTPKQLRVTASLSDTKSRQLLWTQKFDRALAATNIYDVLDEIVQQIVAAIGSAYGIIMRRLSQGSQPKRTDDFTVLDAILRFYYDQRNHSFDTHLAAREALEHAVEIDPNYALAWAALGEVCVDAITLSFSELEDGLEQAQQCILKAIVLDPFCQHAYHALAYLRLRQGDTQGTIEAGHRAIELNPNSAYLVGTCGFWIALAGDFEDGLAIMTNSMQLNPYHPSWFHHAFLVDYYRRGEFELAQVEAEQFHMPDFFWDPLDKAIVLSSLGKEQKAEAALAEVIRLNPDFANDPQRYLKVFVPMVDLQEQMLEGLRKAGLN